MSINRSYFQNFLVLFLSTCLILAVLTSCNSQGFAQKTPVPPPVKAASQFVMASFTNELDQAMNLVCVEEGPAFIVVLKNPPSKSNFVILEDLGDSAKVEVIARFNFKAEQILSFLEQMGVTDIDPLDVSAGLILDVDFKDFNVQTQGDEWCVPRSTLDDFYTYILEMIK